MLVAVVTLLGSFARGDSWFDIIVGGLSVLVLAGAAIALGWRWFKWHGGISWRARFFRGTRRGGWLRGPVTVTYFLPKRTYHERTFPGAASDETFPPELTVSPGTHYVTVCIAAHTDVTVEQVRLTFDEATGIGKDRPVHQGVVPSRWVDNKPVGPDFRGRVRFRDWNGEVKAADDFMAYPRPIPKGDYALVTIEVEAAGDWDGHLVVILFFRGFLSRSMKRQLRFVVTTHPKADSTVTYLEKSAL